jgi:multicomponent Na+:H+ antiporter subunit E
VASRLFYGVLLTVILSVLWLLLSGYWFKPILVGFGVLAVTVALVTTARMGLLDGESVPFARMPHYLKYWSWLGAEIFKANVAVVRIAMAPDLNIKPVMTRVAVSAKTDMARTTYANSITLTPGTVTIEVEETGFLVHALTEEFADQDAFRDMERRSIEAVEGRKALVKPRGEAGS